MRFFLSRFSYFILLFAIGCGSGGGSGSGSGGGDCKSPNNIDLENWNIRWGIVSIHEIDFPSDGCGEKHEVVRITTNELDGILMEFYQGLPGIKNRVLSCNFMVPSFDGWNHLSVFPAYRPPLSNNDPNPEYAFGRIGANVFYDPSSESHRLSIQYDNAGLPPYLGTNLHNFVSIPNGLETNHWYRLEAVILRTPDNSLLVKGALFDVENADVFLVSTEQTFPSFTIPLWYSEDENRLAIGFLDVSNTQNLDTYIDAIQYFTE